MKRLLKCRVAIFMLFGWVACSVIGYIGKDSIYSAYDFDVKKMPYFVLVLDGIRDGIYPWSKEAGSSGSGNPGGLPEGMPGVAETEAKDGDVAGTEAGDGTVAGTEAGTSDVTGTEAGDGIVPETEVPAAPKEFITVDESYFDDAVFIGDSRTVGLHDYGGLDKATFFATVGLNIYDMWDEKFCEVDGEKLTLEEALKKKQFRKVYFQIGINELGRGSQDSFIEQYAASVQKFMELQPEAIIYVQGIMRVAGEKSEKDPIFNNHAIQARNERIAQLADGQKIFYIDMNEVVCDDYGNLRSDLTFDNLHLYGSKYDIWVDFLKTKGIAS